MTAMSTVRCLYCRGSFEARTADRQRGWAQYCSKSCKASHQFHRRQTMAATQPCTQVVVSQEVEQQRMHEDALYDAFGCHGQDGY